MRLASRSTRSPAHSRRLPGGDRLECRGERVERLAKRIERRRILPCTHGDQRQRVHQATQRRVRRERAEQRLRRDQALHRLRDLFRRFEQQSLAVEERAAVGPPYGAKRFASAFEPRREPRCRMLGELGRCAVDDDGDEIHPPRKSRRERELALAPRHVVRDELRRVGVDREMRDDIDECRRAKNRRDGDHARRPGGARDDRVPDQRRQAADPGRAHPCGEAFERLTSNPGVGRRRYNGGSSARDQCTPSP